MWNPSAEATENNTKNIWGYLIKVRQSHIFLFRIFNLCQSILARGRISPREDHTKILLLIKS